MGLVHWLQVEELEVVVENPLAEGQGEVVEVARLSPAVHLEGVAPLGQEVHLTVQRQPSWLLVDPVF